MKELAVQSGRQVYNKLHYCLITIKIKMYENIEVAEDLLAKEGNSREVLLEM